MSDYTIQIADAKLKSFKISLSIGTIGVSLKGKWQTLNKGCIRYNNGKAEYSHVQGTMVNKNIVLLPDDEKYYGVKLDNFMGVFSANEYGEGFVAQSWVLDFEPGRITWTIL